MLLNADFKVSMGLRFSSEPLPSQLSKNYDCEGRVLSHQTPSVKNYA